MATDIFRLLGTISVDTTDFNNKISAALTNVNNLVNALNSLNGTNVNVNVNTNGVTTPVAPTTRTTTPVSAQTTSNGSNGENPANNNDGRLTVNTTIPVSGGGEWTVGRGVMSNLLTDMARMAGNTVQDWLGAGWNRNIGEEMTTAMFETLAGISEAEASALMDQFSEFAQQTPLGVEETWEVATDLLASGITPEGLIDTMWMLGDLARGDNTMIDRIGRAYTQTIGGANFKAQEANQFREAGVPIWRLLETYYASDAYTGDNKGKSMGEIQSGLNDSVIVPSADVDAALRMATSPGGQFHNTMRNMMNTTSGQNQVISDNMTTIAAHYTEPFVDFYSDNVAPFLAETTGDIVDAIEVVEDLDKQSDFLYGDDPLAVFRSSGRTNGPLINARPGGLFFNQTKWGEDYLARDHDEDEDEDEAPTSNSNSPSSSSNPAFQAAIERWREVFESTPGWEHITDNIMETVNPKGPSNNRPHRLEDTYSENEWVGHGAFNNVVPNGNDNMFGAVMQQLATLDTKISAGIQDGMSGVTITANVNTGNVTLNSGELVGALTPQIDLRLGVLGARSNRG